MGPSKILVELDPETADNILGETLSFHLGILKDELKDRKKNKGPAIFETNKKDDIAMIKEHIKAFKLIAKYYGVDTKGL